MPNFKLSILEKDGVEFFGPTEYDAEQLLTELGFYKESGFPFREFSCGLLPFSDSVCGIDGGELGLVYDRATYANGGTL